MVIVCVAPPVSSSSACRPVESAGSFGRTVVRRGPLRGAARSARCRGQPRAVTLGRVLLHGRQPCLGLSMVLPVQVDLLETGPGDPVEGIGVVSEPFGFVTRFREYQP